MKWVYVVWSVATIIVVTEDRKLAELIVNNEPSGIYRMTQMPVLPEQ